MLSKHARAVNRQLDRLDQHDYAATRKVLFSGSVQIGRVNPVGATTAVAPDLP